MIEIIAASLTLVSAILAAFRLRLTWIVGILSSSLYIYVFDKANLMGMVSLQVLMILQSIAGHAFWAKLRVRRMGTKRFLNAVLYATAIFIPVGAMLYFDTFSWIEMSICWLSVLATWLLVKGDPRNWHIWSVANLASVILFTNDGLYVTAGTYFLLLINSIYASWKWQKNGNTDSSSANSIPFTSGMHI